MISISFLKAGNWVFYRELFCLYSVWSLLLAFRRVKSNSSHESESLPVSNFYPYKWFCELRGNTYIHTRSLTYRSMSNFKISSLSYQTLTTMNWWWVSMLSPLALFKICLKECMWCTVSFLFWQPHFLVSSNFRSVCE